MTKNRSGILASTLYCIVCLTATAPAQAQAGPTATAEQEEKAPATTFSAVYKLDLLSTRGGGDSDAGGMGNLDLMLRADLDQALGWQNTIAYLHVLADHGAKINGNHTGSLMGISNIEVPTDTAKLFHAWLQRSYLDDRLSLLAGLYPIDSEFSVMESAGLFLHPAYGPPADLSLTRGPSIFNTSAFGVRVRWNGVERDRYAMAALLDGIPGDPAKPHGTHIRFDAGDGAFAIAEVGFTPPERGHVMEPTDPSSPRTQGEDIRLHEKYESFGKYALGLWGYSERVDDLVDRVGGNPVQRRSRGAYLLAEKTLYRMPGSPVRHLAGPTAIRPPSTRPSISACVCARHSTRGRTTSSVSLSPTADWATSTARPRRLLALRPLRRNRRWKPPIDTRRTTGWRCNRCSNISAIPAAIPL